VLNIHPKTPEEVIENINLCINSAKSIGCDVGDVKIEDLITSDVICSSPFVFDSFSSCDLILRCTTGSEIGEDGVRSVSSGWFGGNLAEETP
jgi:hypothetical protein